MFGGQEMNGKSMEFVKKSIESGAYKYVYINDFDTMKEIEFLPFVKQFFKFNDEIEWFNNNELRYSHTIEENGKQNNKINACIAYDNDADFQYFIAQEYVCDGTKSFHFSLCKEILEKLYYLKTFFKNSEPDDFEENPCKYDIEYTVGNFVLCSKYSDEFSTKKKPWLKERVTVMLPIRNEFIEKWK